MSTLQNTDLFAVRRGTETYKVSYGDILAGVTLPNALEYKGVADPTQPAPSPTGGLKVGMVYVLSPSGTIHASWTGVAGLAATDGQLAVWEGAKWELIGEAGFSLPDATETVKGVAEIATTAAVTAGTDDQRIVTPLKLKGFQQQFTIQSATAPTLVTHPNIVRGTIWVDTSQDPPIIMVWDDTPGPGAWVPAGGAGGGASVDIGATPPATPTAGDMWWNSGDGRLYIYYTDADSSQWVDASPAGAGGPTSAAVWSRTGTVLSPSNAGDDVNIGGTNISLKADGSASFAGAVGVKNRVYTTGANAKLGVYTSFTGSNSIPAVEIEDTSGRKASIWTDGGATFAGKVVTGALDTQNSASVNFISRKTTNGPDTVCRFTSDVAGLSNKTAAEIFANGNATFAGTVTATVAPPSDARFKENITPANPQLADVVALGKQLKNFNWNDKAPLNDELRSVRQLGLIAQEAEKVSPGIVKTIKRTKQGKELTPEKVIPAVYKEVVDPEDEENFLQELVTPEQVIPATYEEVDDSFKGISHDALIMKLLGAVAELSAEIETLETKVAALKGGSI